MPPFARDAVLPAHRGHEPAPGSASVHPLKADSGAPFAKSVLRLVPQDFTGERSAQGAVAVSGMALPVAAIVHVQ